MSTVISRSEAITISTGSSVIVDVALMLIEGHGFVSWSDKVWPVSDEAEMEQAEMMQDELERHQLKCHIVKVQLRLPEATEVLQRFNDPEESTTPEPLLVTLQGKPCPFNKLAEEMLAKTK